jgi:hypothetical protein
VVVVVVVVMIRPRNIDLWISYLRLAVQTVWDCGHIAFPLVQNMQSLNHFLCDARTTYVSHEKQSVLTRAFNLFCWLDLRVSLWG